MLILNHQLSAQNDSCADSCVRVSHPFKYKQLIIPATLIGFGVVGLESGALKSFNVEVKEQFDKHVNRKTSIDNFSMFVPTVAVYGLNWCGVKGRHNFRDRTMIITTSYLIMGAAVFGLKELTRVQRPDNTKFNSFPSGHTAIAFLGAEFLWQEYKDVSVWYGVAGYAVAAGTGFLRMYNNRHWFTDVVAGAGIGMLSTKIAYWIYPSMQKALFKRAASTSKSASISAVAAPYYNGETMGVSLYASF